MKHIVIIAMLFTLPAFSQTAAGTAGSRRKAPVKAVVKEPPTVVPLVIPKNATPNPDGTYGWADKAGKKWVFSKTPFGISKVEDTLGAPAFANASTAAQFVKAIEVGDKVRFERQSPFGTSKWEKAKADLTDEEKSMLAAQSAKPE